MSRDEKSDEAVVPEKPANKAADPHRTLSCPTGQKDNDPEGRRQFAFTEYLVSGGQDRPTVNYHSSQCCL